jgi:hypothetical protein
MENDGWREHLGLLLDPQYGSEICGATSLATAGMI